MSELRYPRGWRWVLAALIAATVAARLVAVAKEGDPARSAMEYGNIAFYIAQGHGYCIRYNHWWPSDPTWHRTRWMMPFYPFLY